MNTLTKETRMNAPQYIFLNYVTYTLYEYYHTWAFKFLISMIVLTITMTFFNPAYLNAFYVAIIFIGTIFLIATLGLHLCIKHENYFFDFESKQQFLKILIDINPGSKKAKWEEIAVKMNTFLFENQYWNTKYYFYNGQCCRDMFNKICIFPYINELNIETTTESGSKWFISRTDRLREKLRVENYGLEIYIKTAREMYLKEIDNEYGSKLHV